MASDEQCQDWRHAAIRPPFRRSCEKQLANFTSADMQGRFWRNDFAVAESGERFGPLRLQITIGPPFICGALCQISRRAWRAAKSRERTVPMGMSRMPAISAYDWPSTSRSQRSERSSALSLLNASERIERVSEGD